MCRYVYLHLPFMWVNIRSCHWGFGVQHISFFFPFNSTWGRVTLNSKTISPTREMRKAKPIFFSVGCRQIGWKKHKTRMYGSVRQFGMVWCLMAFGALYLSYLVGIWNQLVNYWTPPSRGNTEPPARPLLSRLRDWLINKEAEAAVQEDWYVWGTAQCLLCCASTKLWMKIRLGFGMYFCFVPTSSCQYSRGIRRVCSGFRSLNYV